MKRRFKEKSSKGVRLKPVHKIKPDSLQIWESYSIGFNKKRIVFEIVLPIVLSVITLFVYLFSHTSNVEIYKSIKSINIDIFTIVTIQIGFNVTSLALIGAFNKNQIKNIFSKLTELSQKEKMLKQLLSSFVYCVFIQTGIIVIAFFYNINVDEFIKFDFSTLSYNVKKYLSLIILSLWIGIILHTFMVTIRNVILIYKFILVYFKG